MIRLYLILVIILCLSSCKRDNNFDGIWVGSYETVDSDFDSFPFPLNLIIEFSNDSIIIKIINDDFRHKTEILKPKKYQYRIEGNKLIIESDTLLIRNKTQDSLVLSPIDKDETRQVYRKLKSTNSNIRTKLSNKSYAVKFENHTDTIDFINDSLLARIANNQFNKWGIDYYKNLDILLIDDFFTSPYFVTYDSGNVIELTCYYWKFQKVKMIEIIDKKDTTNLIGNWIWPYNSINENNHPPPPPAPYPNTDPKIYLHIKNDSIEIEQYGRKLTLKWELNSTNEYILFPSNGELLNRPWQILQLKKEKLELKGNIEIFRRSEESILKFEKE